MEELTTFIDKLNLDNHEIKDNDVDEVMDLISNLGINEKVKPLQEQCSPKDDFKPTSNKGIIPYENNLLKNLFLASKIIKFLKTNRINHKILCDDKFINISGLYKKKMSSVEFEITIFFSAQRISYRFKKYPKQINRSGGICKIQGMQKTMNERDLQMLLSYVS